jgi:hypothetical protein
VTRRISILGATGSVGKSTLDLVERNPDRFEVVAVTAATNAQALADIARRTGASLAVVADESRLGELEELLVGTNCRAAAGEAALVEAATAESDLLIAAIVGCAGLRPVMAAVDAGKPVALANKEALVTAGELGTIPPMMLVLGAPSVMKKAVKIMIASRKFAAGPARTTRKRCHTGRSWNARSRSSGGICSRSPGSLAGPMSPTNFT